jgi:Regulator of chromosome condensation (RCC1) repeat
MSETEDNKDVLKMFLAEAATAQATEVGTESETLKKSELADDDGAVKIDSPTAPLAGLETTPTYGDLLITGCNDWDNMTSREASGLEVPHLIRLKAPVSRVFSSSSSCHLFLTLNTGDLYSFGKNSNGQLGLGDKITRIYPTIVKVSEFSKYRVSQVASGKNHTLLVMSDGEIFACGANNFGQCGLGDGKSQKEDQNKFKVIPFGFPVREAACGENHSIFCTRDGQLYTFGHPEFGQLGHGTNGIFHQEGGGKRGGLQHKFIAKPQKVNVFCTKDAKGKLTGESLSIR